MKILFQSNSISGNERRLENCSQIHVIKYIGVCN